MKTLLLICFLIASFSPRTVGQESAATEPQTVKTTKQMAPGEQIWVHLMAGNQRFVNGKTRAREFAHLRHALLTGQHPKVVVLTCSDSRVPPEILFDQSLGDLFVVRSAGNVADAIGLGSIEYAVEHLGSSVLVVLGHEKCGAVTAACSGSKMPTANLQAIVDRIDPAVTKAGEYAKPDELLDAAIRENIDQSAKDVLAHSEVLRHALKEGKLTVFEAIYKLDSGEVSRLGKLAVVDPAFKLDVGEVVRVE